MKQKRIEEAGIHVGVFPRGPLNKITDVPGVRVGHATVREAQHHTGVTVVMPCEDNMFANKLTAASFVLNGFGKTQGLVQIDELGTLETPIALTNTLNVGKVHDALVTYMAERCEQDGIQMQSLNPVVGECNDSSMNAICDRPVTGAHVLEAIRSACRDFEEGDVGAGCGTICHGLKGGIGSASRVITIGEREYVLGVLVQSNHGCLEELTVNGRALGREIIKKREQAPVAEPTDRGSIMMLVATDLPATDRQLRRILKRCAAGLARGGSYYGHGSGDVMIGFSTANRVPHGGEHRVLTYQAVTEHSLEMAFRATSEATHEAVLNSMYCAHAGRKLDGTPVETLADYL